MGHSESWSVLRTTTGLAGLCLEGVVCTLLVFSGICLFGHKKNI